MLEIIQNTDVVYSETFTKDALALNLTGYASVTLFVFSDPEETTAVLEQAGVIADAVGGIVNFTIPVAKTNLKGTYYGHYKFVDGSGLITKTDQFKVNFIPSFDKA